MLEYGALILQSKVICLILHSYRKAKSRGIKRNRDNIGGDWY